MLYIDHNRVREAAGRKKEPEDVIWWFQPFTLCRFGCVHRFLFVSISKLTTQQTTDRHPA